MNFVETVQSNWRSLPGKVRGAICAAGGAAFGTVELYMTETMHPNWKQLAMHAGAAALAGFIGYMVPNANNHGKLPAPGASVAVPPPEKESK